MAARVFTRLKELHLPFELVDEAIKSMAWRKIPPEGFDSLWLFGKQIHREDVVLRSGGSVVTGGPPLQQIVYMRLRKEEFSHDLMHVAQMFEKQYPAVNILLSRNVPYSTEGRYQSNEAEAKEIDLLTRKVLDYSDVEYHVFQPQQIKEIMNLIGVPHE